MTQNEPLPRKIFLRGEYDLSRRDDLARRLTDALAGRPATVLIDFADLTFIDAGTLGMLERAQRLATALGIELRSVHVDDPHVRRVLHILDLWNCLTALVPPVASDLPVA